MVLSWFASKLTPIAVDIGTDTIKLLQVEPRDGGRIIGIGAEPIDRLGRERDQAAIGEAVCGGRQGGLVHGQNLRFEPHIHWALSPQFRFLR